MPEAHGRLAQPTDQAKAGKSYVALMDAAHLDDCHLLERERIHLPLLEDAQRGLADTAAGRTQDAVNALTALQQRGIAALKRRD